MIGRLILVANGFDKKFFYLNGHLHRTLSIKRKQNLVYAYDTIEEKNKVYNYYDLQKNAKKAYPPREVGKLFDRESWTTTRWILNKKIPPPQRIHKKINGLGGTGQYMWSEEDIWNAWHYLTLWSCNAPVISEEKLKMALNSKETLFMKKNGRYVPVWKGKL